MRPRQKSRSRQYRLQYAQQAQEHLQALRARQRAVALDKLETQLRSEPTVETRNRKRIEENPLGATFELRIGELRVYYDVEESSRMVNVIAVGIKERNRVRIGTEEVEL